jgi:hypothetical protein
MQQSTQSTREYGVRVSPSQPAVTAFESTVVNQGIRRSNPPSQPENTAFEVTESGPSTETHEQKQDTYRACGVHELACLAASVGWLSSASPCLLLAQQNQARATASFGTLGGSSRFCRIHFAPSSIRVDLCSECFPHIPNESANAEFFHLLQHARSQLRLRTHHDPLKGSQAIRLATYQERHHHYPPTRRQQMPMRTRLQACCTC